MDRRELLRMVAFVTGGAVIGGELFLSGCKQTESSGLTFSEKDIAFLDEVAETILPQTQSPGAKAAKTGQFITVMVNDCYKKEDQQVFQDGMKRLEEACNKMYGHSFMKAAPAQRTELLTSLDRERKEYMEQKQKDDPNHYFQQMKQLAILGYFTSKEGREGALRYVPVPGRFEGIIDYKKGDKAFAGIT